MASPAWRGAGPDPSLPGVIPSARPPARILAPPTKPPSQDRSPSMLRDSGIASQGRVASRAIELALPDGCRVRPAAGFPAGRPGDFASFPGSLPNATGLPPAVDRSPGPRREARVRLGLGFRKARRGGAPEQLCRLMRVMAPWVRCLGSRSPAYCSARVRRGDSAVRPAHAPGKGWPSPRHPVSSGETGRLIGRLTGCGTREPRIGTGGGSLPGAGESPVRATARATGTATPV